MLFYEIHSSVLPAYRVLRVALCLMILTACGGGGGGGGGDAPSVVGGSSGGGGTPGVTLAGGGADGPVVGGDIYIYDRDGKLCVDPVSTQQDSQYAIFLPIFGCEAPWQVVLSAGDDLVTGEVNYTTMYSLVMDIGVVPLNVNVSPLTTIIYFAALANTSSGNSLAEVDDEGVNIDLISRAVMRKFNFGMGGDDIDFDPLTSEINSSNAKSFVKGNEGLIETVRRTAWQFYGVVDGVAVGNVLLEIGEDMADGILNGLVRPGVASAGGTRLAMLWELNAATVAMELMTNQLSVTLEGGAILVGSSTSALADAAASVSDVAVSDSDIENVAVDSLFIRQATEAATAASELAGGVGVFVDFLQTLAVLEGELVGGDVVPASFVQRSMAPLGDVALAQAEALALYREMITGRSPTVPVADVDKSLAASASASRKSTPVYKASRTVHVEWSYPDNVLLQGGFKLYRQVGDAANLVCYIANPKARSTAGYESDCAIAANPGEKVSLFLAAYDAAKGVESPPSIIYENYLPEVEFSVDQLFAECPNIFTFDASASSTVSSSRLQFDWLFVDGTVDVSLSPDHLFEQSGTYPVLLTSTSIDPSGLFSASSQASLAVSCF